MTTIKTTAVVLLSLVLLAAAILSSGFARFKRDAERIAGALLTQSGDNSPVVTAAMLEGLPAPVQRYLTYSGVVGKPIARTVRLKQTGRIRQDAASPWMQLTAEEYYSTNPPGLLWFAKATMNGLPIVRVRDSYVQGKGHMYASAAGLVTVLDMEGPEMDQGALMRYLNEMLWFPSAFLGDNVTWQPIDDHRAQVSLTDHGLTVSATLFFDDEGRVTDFLADRYRNNGDGTSSLLPWSTPIHAYRQYPSGLRLPAEGVGVWHLPSGEKLVYVELTIEDVEENHTDLY
jgi:hypothetical protein